MSQEQREGMGRAVIEEESQTRSVALPYHVSIPLSLPFSLTISFSFLTFCLSISVCLTPSISDLSFIPSPFPFLLCQQDMK